MTDDDVHLQDSSTSALVRRWQELQASTFRAATFSMPGEGTLVGVPGTGHVGFVSAPPASILSSVSASPSASASPSPSPSPPPDVPGDLPAIAIGVSLIETRGETHEGLIVAAVRPAWLSVLRELERNPEVLFGLESWQFEQLIAGGYRADGWEVVLTPRSNDGGIDVIATRADVGAIKILDQAKLYKPNHAVGPDEVRELIGALTLQQAASKAIISTTSRFTSGALRAVRHLTPTRIELRDGEAVNDWLTRVYGKTGS